MSPGTPGPDPHPIIQEEGPWSKRETPSSPCLPSSRSPSRSRSRSRFPRPRNQTALRELQCSASLMPPSPSPKARRLAELLRALVPSNAFQTRRLRDAGFDPASIGPDETAGSVLARLPFTTKSDLEEDQERNPPFGTNLTFPLERYTRIHHTSGTTGRPLWWLDTPESWSRSEERRVGKECRSRGSPDH